MKRKLKIVGTIASLGLCLAMLVIGVYAATTVTFSISASVSFTVTEAFVDLTGKVYLGPVASVKSNEVTAKAYTESSYNPDDTVSAWNIGDVAFTSTNDCIVYELTIVNAAKSGTVNVKFSALPVAVTGTTVTAQYKVADGALTNLVANTDVSLPATQTMIVTITRTLNDKTTAITSTTAWNPTVTIANPAANQ